jgi:acetolactate synthase regulatory subunit
MIATFLAAAVALAAGCTSEPTVNSSFPRSDAAQDIAAPADQAALLPVPPAASESSTGSAFAASASERAVSGKNRGEVPAASTAVTKVLAGGMLIRVGQASVQVDSLEVGLERVREVARRTGAVIANTSLQGGRERVRAASLELRIPSDRFDDAVNGLAPIGRLESVNVSVQDVGEEYVDVEARVANARRLEQRLIELLANRTGKLADVLTVERELARVREEIERYEGRLRYLRARSAVSTLTVAMHEPYPIVASRPGERPIRDAFVQAWRNLVGVTATFIASLGVIVPLGVIAVAVILLGRRVMPPRALRLAPEQTADANRS